MSDNSIIVSPGSPAPEKMTVPRKCGECGDKVDSSDLDSGDYKADPHHPPTDRDECKGTGKKTRPIPGLHY